MNALEHAIISQDFSQIPVDVLEKTNLAAYTYAHNPLSRNERTKKAFLQFHMRHHLIKTQLVSLFRAWHAAGISVMLYKGFHLSEYVYDKPAERFYGDIDLIIKPQETKLAYEIARSMGWHVDHVYQAHHTHQAFYGESNQGHVRFEVHHQTVPMHYPLRTQWRQRFSEKIWQCAQLVDCDGVPVYIPQPVDAMLLLIMDRYYNDKSREFLRHKVHDFLDMMVLKKRGNISEELLLTRAKSLDCLATVRWFLRCCNPWRKYLKLHSARWKQWQVAWELSLFYGRKAAFERLIANGIVIALAVRESLAVVQSLYQLQRYRELELLFRKNTTSVTADSLNDEQSHYNELSEGAYGKIYGVKWATVLLRWLIRLQGSGVCLVRSLTLYRQLQLKGYDVRFVSGVMRDEQGVLKGHAWVEYARKPLPMLGDEHSPARFKESWCYPPR